MKQAEISLNTKRKLAECLKSKMKEKSFAKITVSELVKETNINRKTFYYHFDDIYSLFKWMLEEEAINIVRHFDLLVDSEEAIILLIVRLIQWEEMLFIDFSFPILMILLPL